MDFFTIFFFKIIKIPKFLPESSKANVFQTNVDSWENHKDQGNKSKQYYIYSIY